MRILHVDPGVGCGSISTRGSGVTLISSHGGLDLCECEFDPGMADAFFIGKGMDCNLYFDPGIGYDLYGLFTCPWVRSDLYFDQDVGCGLDNDPGMGVTCILTLMWHVTVILTLMWEVTFI